MALCRCGSFKTCPVQSLISVNHYASSSQTNKFSLWPYHCTTHSSMHSTIPPCMVHQSSCYHSWQYCPYSWCWNQPRKLCNKAAHNRTHSTNQPQQAQCVLPSIIGWACRTCGLMCMTFTAEMGTGMWCIIQLCAGVSNNTSEWLSPGSKWQKKTNTEEWTNTITRYILHNVVWSKNYSSSMKFASSVVRVPAHYFTVTIHPVRACPLHPTAAANLTPLFWEQ